MTELVQSEVPPSSRQSEPPFAVSTPSTVPPPSIEARPPRVRWIALFSAVAVVLVGALAVPSPPALSQVFGVLEFPVRPAIALGPGQELEALELAELEAACPAEMALVEHGGARSCIDRWEGTVVEIQSDGTEVPFPPYAPIDPHRRLRAVSRPDVVPQGYISRNEAAKVCAASGKRLCGGSEWIAACEGPSATVYPYGDDEDPKACNTHGQNSLVRLFGRSKRAFSLGPMNHALLNRLPGTVARTGAFAACTNAIGVHDMVGNLHEWTAEDEGTFRGGYYLDATTNGRGCRYATTKHHPTYHDYSTGFRCCKDVDS